MYFLQFLVLLATWICCTAAVQTRYVYLCTNASTSSVLPFSLTWTAADPPELTLTPLAANVSIANPQYGVLHPYLPVLYNIERGAAYQPGALTLPTNTNNATALNALFSTTLSGGLTAVSLQKNIPSSIISRVPSFGSSPDFVGLLGTTVITPANPQKQNEARGTYFLTVTTYNSGTTSVYKLDPHTGEILYPPTTVFFFPVVESDLTSANSRQGIPTGHHSTQSTAPVFGKKIVVAAPDLGDDRIKELTLDLETGALTDREADLVSPLGSGPRHTQFHPFNSSVLYAINEVASTVSVFDFAQKTLLATYNNLPANFTGTNTAAEIVVHPNGRFLYASNRGHNSVVVYKIDQETFLLTQIDIVPSGGAFPRYITLVPLDSAPHDKCRYILLLSNHNTPNVVAFSVNHETGLLGKIFSQATPLSGYGLAVSRLYDD
ncbi:Lactonase, 7-bladed beta-propeller-domain-containing protein [Cladochytrium replicatum]|nr:Lactonase, 7-bladed beta-propeller-domain-containing protein [Cladochytrium replicatum]